MELEKSNFFYDFIRKYSEMKVDGYTGNENSLNQIDK